MDNHESPTAVLGAEPVARSTFEGLKKGGVFGRYVVLDELGTGGQGVVYAAWDDRLGRRVALKLLLAATPLDDAKLVREARALAQLSHPNVVAVYELGEAEGLRYLAMELVEGVTLRHVLAVNPPPASALVPLLLQAGEGLAAIHRAGLVHRDVKPANILVGRDGRVCLTDFGLARYQRSNEESSPSAIIAPTSPTDDALTQEGAVAGTLRFMAPEQLEGSPPDARSDQFAFAVTAWFALSTVLPFADDVKDPEARVALIKKGPAGRIAPRRIEAALKRALSPDPTLRFESMQALLVELSGQAASQRRRRLTLTAVALTVPFALAVGGYLGLERSKRCTPAAVLADTWLEPHRQRLSEAIAPHLGAESTGEVVRTLDSWFARWGQAAATACDAKQDLGCLEFARDDATALVKALSEPGLTVDVAREARLAVLALPTVQSCAAVKGRARFLRTADRLPLVQLLSAARTSLLTGEPSKAVTAAQAALEGATHAHDEVLVGEARYELGRALEEAGKSPRAHEVLQRAFADGVRLKESSLEARAGVQLLFVLGSSVRHLEAAEELEPIIAAAVEREDNAELRATFLAARSGLRSSQGRISEAHADVEAALLEEHRRVPEDARRIARLRSIQGMSLMQLGRIDEAQRLSAENVDTLRTLVPPGHPQLARALNNFSVALLRVDDRVRARAAIDEAEKNFIVSLGPAHPHTAAPLNNLGELELREGHLDAAERAFTDAQRIIESALGANTSRALESKLGLARVLQERGQLAAAKRAMHAIVEERVKTNGPAHFLTLEAQLTLAQLQLEAEELTEAKQLIDTLAAAGPEAVPELGLLQGVLALFGGKPTAARQLFELAELKLGTQALPLRRQEVAAALALGRGVELPRSPVGRALGKALKSR